MKKMSKLQLIYVSLLLANSFSSFAQVGIGTDTPHASAALEIRSTTKGFLPPRMTLKQIHTIATPAEGLMVYCTNCSTIGVFVNNGTKFINIVNGNRMNVFDTITDVVDVLSSTGKRWMDRNLGATRVATSSTDEDSYGHLYQWGRAKDGHESRDSGVIATTATGADAGHDKFITGHQNWTDFADEDTLWQSGLNDPCPVGYRIPTASELDGEFQVFKNAAGALSSVLKLPLAGNRGSLNGQIANKGVHGGYWSSTSKGLYFNSTNVWINSSDHSEGLSVRCIKE
jgi:hypothetical protein